MRAAGYVPPKHLVAIASSTGGPSALLEIFGKVPRTCTAGIVVAQHMPDKFTRTFAERLDRKGPVRTSEGQDGDRADHEAGVAAALLPSGAGAQSHEMCSLLSR